MVLLVDVNKLLTSAVIYFLSLSTQPSEEEVEYVGSVDGI